MSTVVEQLVFVDEWRGLYSESWKGVIVDEAFAHPAKFSRALIRKIYDHVIAERWATKGSSVIDPFGGVALGGFDAMRLGLNWTGCELESKFVSLGGQNIALWNERFSRMPNWGTARLIQGDSRKLGEVLSIDVDACISSPPFLDARTGTTASTETKGGGPCADRVRSVANGNLIGQSEGQLGAMKEGDHSIVISSPPYIDSVNSSRSGIDWDKAQRPDRRLETHRGKGVQGAGDHAMAYGKTDGQLGAMPEGDLCVTSPPYADAIRRERPQGDNQIMREKAIRANYGNSDGQLEGMSMDGFGAVVTSPPYEGTPVVDLPRGTKGAASGGIGTQYRLGNRAKGAQRNADGSATEGYGNTEGQIAYTSGETFWSASRLILEQLHQVLTPNAHAVFVTKRFVRDKQIVEFTDQWIQLCEAVGFRLLHRHKAMLVEDYGTQGGFESDKRIQVARKSFFRRLAESKNSPAIDWEDVTCFVRVA